MRPSRRKSPPRVNVQQVVNQLFVVTVTPPPVARDAWLLRIHRSVALWLVSVFFQLMRLCLW